MTVYPIEKRPSVMPLLETIIPPEREWEETK